MLRPSARLCPGCQRRAWTDRGPARAGYVKIAGWACSDASSSPEWAPSRPSARRSSLWKGLLDGACGIRPLSLFDASGLPHADRGRGPGDPGRFPDGRRAAPHVPRRPDGRRRRARGHRQRRASTSRARTRRGSGVILGGGTSGLIDSEAFFELYLRGRKARPSKVLNHLPDSITDRVAQRFGLEGIKSTITTACSSSANAMGYAFDAIAAGLADVVVTGGSDVLARLTYGGFNSLRSVDPGSLPPLRPRPQGPLDRRGRRDPGLRRGGARAPPRRSDRRRVPRLRRHLRRVPHDGARSLGDRRRPHDPAALDNARLNAGRRGLRQRARHGDAAERLRRDRGAQGRPRRARAADPDLLHQVDDRALPLRLRRDRGRGHRPDRARRPGAADDPLREPGPGVRPRLRPQRGPGPRRPRRPLELVRLRRQQLGRRPRALRHEAPDGFARGSSPGPAPSLRSAAAPPEFYRGA